MNSILKIIKKPFKYLTNITMGVIKIQHQTEHDQLFIDDLETDNKLRTMDKLTESIIALSNSMKFILQDTTNICKINSNVPRIPGPWKENNIPNKGTQVYLITNDEIRWHGTIYKCIINKIIIEESYITLKNIRLLGTDDRVTDRPIPPKQYIYRKKKFILKNISNIFYKETFKKNLNNHTVKKINETNEEWILEGPGPMIRVTKNDIKIPDLLTLNDMPIPGTQAFLILKHGGHYCGKVIRHEKRTQDNIVHDSMDFQHFCRFEFDKEGNITYPALLNKKNQRTVSVSDIRNIFFKKYIWEDLNDPSKPTKLYKDWVFKGIEPLAIRPKIPLNLPNKINETTENNITDVRKRHFKTSQSLLKKVFRKKKKEYKNKIN